MNPSVRFLRPAEAASRLGVSAKALRLYEQRFPLAREKQIRKEFLKPGLTPKILIVTDRRGASGPMIVHNIGAGTRVEDRLYEFSHTGHYRLTPEVLARMRAVAG